MTSERPAGWSTVRLAQLVDRLQYGYTASASTEISEPKFLRITDIQGHRVDWTCVPGCPATQADVEKYQLRNGDIVFARSGSIEKAWLVADVPRQAIFASYLIRATPQSEPVGVWLNQFIRSPGYLSQIGAAAAGSGMQNVNAQKLGDVEVPIAPLNEQRRIVAKLEALQARSRRAREALDAVPPLLERLRQSILAAAFRGDLTKDWRAKQKDVEPAAELLKRVRAERRQKWEGDELARLKSKGKHPTDDKWKAKYVEPEPIDAVGLPELPRGWCWIALGELGADPFNAVQTGPFGALLHNTEFVRDGVPVIAVGNLTGLGFRRDGLYFVTPKKAQELERFDVQSGDVLFARSGATTGKVCVAPSFVRDWRMTGHILRLRVNQSLLKPEIAVFALAGAPVVRAQVMGNIRGATRPGYNTGLLESIVLPVPPIDEQEALVEALSGILASVDELGRQNEQRLHMLLKLDRSLLAKAFRGELVPQDPNDEPAESMLARGRAAKGSAPANGTPSKPGRPRAARRAESSND